MHVAYIRESIVEVWIAGAQPRKGDLRLQCWCHGAAVSGIVYDRRMQCPRGGSRLGGNRRFPPDSSRRWTNSLLMFLRGPMNERHSARVVKYGFCKEVRTAGILDLPGLRPGPRLFSTHTNAVMPRPASRG